MRKVMYLGLVCVSLIALSCKSNNDSKKANAENAIVADSSKSKILQPIEMLDIENELFQREKDTIKEVINWDEFNEDSEERNPIAEKVFVRVTFHIDTEWANEEIPLNNVYFKTTLQLVYGKAVLGDNICNSTNGEEIVLLTGKFTGKDLENMFLNTKETFSGMRYITTDFSLRNYLIKNKINLMNIDGDKRLGRIIIRTYVGDSKENMTTISETVKNVIKNYYRE